MSERFRVPSRVGQSSGACRAKDFGEANASEFWPSIFGILDQSLAFRLKNPLYFSCCLQGGLFLYPQQLHVMHPLSKNADGFGETNPTFTQIESIQTWPNEPKQSWRRASALAGPARAATAPPIVISAIAEGSRHNDFAIFRKRSQSPQTKQHRKGKRNNAPR
jgi:hypothetical protein